MGSHRNHEGTALLIIHFIVLSITLIMAFCSAHSAVRAIAHPPFQTPVTSNADPIYPQTRSIPRRGFRANVSVQCTCYFYRSDRRRVSKVMFKKMTTGKNCEEEDMHSEPRLMRCCFYARNEVEPMIRWKCCNITPGNA